MTSSTPLPLHPTPQPSGAFQHVVAIARTHMDAMELIKNLVATGIDPRAIQLVVPRPFLTARFEPRKSYARIAVNGALRGAWVGLIVGLVLAFLDTSQSAVSVVASMVGLAAGVLMALAVISAAFQERYAPLPACYYTDGDQYLITCTDKDTLAKVHQVMALVANPEVITIVDGRGGPSELEFWLPVPALMPGARQEPDAPAKTNPDTADLDVIPPATGLTYGQAIDAAKKRAKKNT